MRRLVLTLALLAYAPRAWAGGPAAPAPAATPVCDGPDCAVQLQQGQAAPYQGQLLTDHLAVSLGQKADQADRRLQLELDYRDKLHLADLNEQKQLASIAMQGVQQENGALKRENAELSAWYRKPLVIVGVTTVLTLIVTALAIDGAEHLRK